MTTPNGAGPDPAGPGEVVDLNALLRDRAAAAVAEAREMLWRTWERAGDATEGGEAA